MTYKSRGDIMLCGDLNARTGVEQDCILQDDARYIPLHESYNVDKQINSRWSKDPTLNKRGKEILDLCISNQLREYSMVEHLEICLVAIHVILQMVLVLLTMSWSLRMLWITFFILGCVTSNHLCQTATVNLNGNYHHISHYMIRVWRIPLLKLTLGLSGMQTPPHFSNLPLILEILNQG